MLTTACGRCSAQWTSAATSRFCTSTDGARRFCGYAAHDVFQTAKSLDCQESPTLVEIITPKMPSYAVHCHTSTGGGERPRSLDLLRGCCRMGPGRLAGNLHHCGGRGRALLLELRVSEFRRAASKDITTGLAGLAWRFKIRIICKKPWL